MVRSCSSNFHNTPLSITNTTCRQKVTEERGLNNNTLNKQTSENTNRILQKSIFSSKAHGSFPKTDQILGLKTSFKF
jgi:hypothetical protein